MGFFCRIPNSISYEDLEFDRLQEEFPKTFSDLILRENYDKAISKEGTTFSAMYYLPEKIMVEISQREIEFLFCESSPLLTRLLEFVEGFKIELPDTSRIHLVIMGRDGFENKRMEFRKPELDLDGMYHSDFRAFHQRMLTHLEQDQQSGLHLLHGRPGTGKSSYIKYLCSLVKKKVVFLSGQLAQNLDNVSMTKYLIENSGVILVIEDAEELIISRGSQRNSNLAMVLNLTDGILGECLGIQIIATFNTDLCNIDPALKRKGRLKTSYEFKPLPVEKVNALLKKEDLNLQTDRELTLAEIFNYKEEEQFRQERQAVGFK